MKPGKIFFIISLLGILTLMFLTQTIKDQTGIIKSIKYSENKITIQLENQNETLILFNPTSLNLEIGDAIYFRGKSDIYRGEKQIIIDKIRKEK